MVGSLTWLPRALLRCRTSRPPARVPGDVGPCARVPQTGQAGAVTGIEQRAGSHRLSHLDNLRTALVAWVIGGHALLGYTVIGGWPYDEVNEVTFAAPTEFVLTTILGPSGIIVIGLLFFIAGMLSEPAVRRHGARRYVRQRLVWLGVPWLASAVLIWPASMWLAFNTAGHRVSFWWVLRHRDPLLDSGSLWFALVLMLFSIMFALGSAWLRRKPAIRSRRPPRPITTVDLVVAVVAIALSSFVVRLWFPVHSRQVGDLHLWWWPECAGLFALGIVVGRRGWARHVPDRTNLVGRWATLITLALLPVIALLAGVRNPARGLGPAFGGWHWQSAVAVIVESTLVVACSIWLVGLAERRLDGGSERTGHWTRAAFTAFVIQGPVLIVLASAGRLLSLPAEVKAPLVAVVAIVVCFWIGRLAPVRFGPSRLGSGGRHSTSAEPEPDAMGAS